MRGGNLNGDTNKPLAIRAESLQDLATIVQADVSAALASQGNLMNEIASLEAELEDTVTKKEKPFEGGSEVHIPLTLEKIDTTGLLVKRVVFGSRPLVTVKPLLPQDTPTMDVLTAKEKMEAFIDAALEYGDFEVGYDCASWEAGVGGTGLLRVRFEEASQMVRLASQDGSSDVAWKSFVGVAFDFIRRKDFFMFPAHSSCIEKAKGCGHVFKLRRTQIMEKAKAGEYDMTAAEAIMKLGTSETEADDIPEQQRWLLGVNRQQLTSPEDNEMDLWEMLVRFSPAKGEPATDWWAVFSPDAKMFLKFQKHPYWHGRRWYVPFYWKKRAGAFDGRGMARILRGLNNEVDALHRQAIDTNTINIQPPITAPMSTIQQMTRKRIGPAQVIPSEMPDAVRRITDPIQAINLAETQLLEQFADKLTGVSAITSGSPLSTERTATEVNLFQSGSNNKVNDIIRTMHGSSGPKGGYGIIEAVYQMLWLYYQYWDLWSQSVFAPKFEMGRAALISPMRIEGNGLSTEDLPETKRQSIIAAWQMFGQDPILLGDPERRTRAANIVAHVLGVSDFLPTPEEQQAKMQQQQMQQRQAEMQAIQAMGGPSPEEQMMAESGGAGMMQPNAPQGQV